MELFNSILRNSKNLLQGTILLFFGNVLVLSASTDSTFIVIADTITIASEPDYPPYCLLDENGNAAGFSVDLFKAAAQAVGLEVKVNVGVWNVIKEDLKEGRIDALPVVGRTPEREHIFDFTMPYLSLHGAIFVRNSTTDILTINDLKDKEILVMKGDNSEEFVRRENISRFIITTNTFQEAFRNLANGECDAVITQRIIGMKLIDRMKLRTIVPLDIQMPNFRQDFCFAVQEGNKELVSRLNEGLSIIIANNTYEEIHYKWFGPDVQENLSFADILKIGILIVVPIAIALSLLVIFLLRKALIRKNRILLKEVSEHKKTLKTLNAQQSLLKQNEGQIRLLLNSTAEGIYGIDLEGNCTFINKSALQMLKFSDEKELIGKSIHDLIHFAHSDGSVYLKEDCKIHQAFKNGSGTHIEDEVLWRADGVCFSAEYYSYPIRENDKIIGSVVTFWDITERTQTSKKLKILNDELETQVNERTSQLEEKVQKLNKSQKAMLYMVEDLNRITSELKEERRKLELSNQELDAFSYSVSHDLRSPLRAIDGFSRFLMEDYFDKLDEEGRRFLSVIRQNTEKMDTLISDILDLSRISRTEMRSTEVEMFTTARSMFLEIATDDEKKTFEITINKIPPISCDFNLIKQVWQNLISNALKYSAKSEIKKIEIGATDQENNVTYYVKDYGAGFDPKYADKLFGVFQRLHKADQFEGTGVGLAIVQRIVHKHGGKVWAESELNKGAVFYFSLPKLN
jgi:PAS domain S-box-containing protein